MDKPGQSEPLFISKKHRGFALLITLSVLAVLMGLTGVLLNYFSEARKSAVTTHALIQGDLYYTDIQKVIKNFKEKKLLYQTLYQSPLPLASPDGRFQMVLACRPMANGININWLGYEENATMQMQYQAANQLFETLSQEYNLVDPERLKELLLEEIGRGGNGIVQKESMQLLQKNGIISLQQLKRIVARYQFEVDDPEVSKIVWRKFFCFSTPGNSVDSNYLSAELIALLFNIEKEAVKDTWVAGMSKLREFLQQNGVDNIPKFYATKFLEAAQCNVQYSYQDERYAFSFIDRQGEVRNFEFYGKQ